MDVHGVVRGEKLESSRRLLLELRGSGFDRGLLAADDAVGLGGALVDLVAAGDEDRRKVLAAEADVVGLLRGGDDEVHAAGLVADLDAQRGGDVEPAVGVHAEAFGIDDAVIS